MSAHLMRRVRRSLVPAAIGGAAVVTVAAVGGVAVISPETVASTMHGITAPFIGASANPMSAEDFYQRTVRGGRDAVVLIDFYTGTLGSSHALTEASGAPAGGELVASPQWGASDARLLSPQIDGAAHETVLVPAHTVARPDAESGSTEALFETSEDGSPAGTASSGTQVVDVGYEYDIDGNSPSYFLNGVAIVNSLMAHLDRTTSRRDLDVPVSLDADGAVVVRDGCEAGCRTAAGFARIDRVGDTTYVSYEAEDLPLTRPLRRHGGPTGQRIADAIDPALKTIVDYGYRDNDPLANPGTNPSTRLMPTQRETRKFAGDLTNAVRDGVGTLARPERPDTRASDGVERG